MNKRVSIRTLVLMVELLGFFVAYQCLVFIPSTKAPARPRVVRVHDQPDRPADANVSGGPTVSPEDLPENIGDCTPALRRAIEARETERTWHAPGPADPNDRAAPDDSEPASEEVE